ncbi:hypothetical protein F4804DRAFT_334623 [Jackrogersella minutella]|nr:hypothetical protein F4804DRAFT_334623 [Jackrogersella minutella]
MDRNPFQSINERRNKFTMDPKDNNTSQVQQAQQTQPTQASIQPPSLRSTMQNATLPSRGRASANWRAQEASDEIAAISSRGNSNEYNSFELLPQPTISHSLHHPSNSLGILPSYANTTLEQYHQPLSGFATYTMATTPSAPETSLDGNYAYCFDRGNGQYTRLVPVDMLPPLRDVPALQQGSAGMIVLPMPRALPPNGRSSNSESVMLKSAPTTPSSRSDTIQSRIDTIVASTPPTPPHNQSLLSMSSGGATGIGAESVTPRVGINPPNAGTHLTGHIHGAQNAGGTHGGGHGGHGGGGQQPQRRPKIYCDKWVHEGVCAFTQQGCKYKHEMPFDKVTQHQLGLFHGFPAWWKKAQADLSRQREPVAAGSTLANMGGGLGMGRGDDTASRLSSADRYMARGGGGPGPGNGSSSAANNIGAALGVSPGAAGDVATAAMGPGSSNPGIPTWRRNAEHHPSEPKSMGTGRGMARSLGHGTRNPVVSYGSPFGPIAPPARLSTSTPTTMYHAADPANAGQDSSNQTGGPRKRLSSVGSTATTNPYSSLESLDEAGHDTGAGEEETSVSAAHSSGARLN